MSVGNDVRTRGQTPPRTEQVAPSSTSPAHPVPALPPADWTRSLGHGVTFTEDMHGSVSGVGGTKAAEVLGRGAGLTFRVTITTDDVDAMRRDPGHSAGLTGTVNCPALGGQLPIEYGKFQLFPINEQSGQREMRYDIRFRSKDGELHRLIGTKFVADDKGFDAWTDLTTLHTKLYKGEDTSRPPIGEGILRLNAWDFAKQLTTFRGTGEGGFFQKAKSLLKFAGFFLGNLWDTYVVPKFKMG